MAAKSATRTVIVAYDGSEHSTYALDYYVKHIYKAGDYIILLHIPELNDMLHSSRWANSVYVFDRDVLESMLRDEQKRVQADLERFAETLKSYNLGGKVKSISCARPGEGIVKEAETQRASLVVVGSRGLGAMRRTLIGSVSDYLVHHLHCPVLVVKHPKHLHLHGEPESLEKKKHEPKKSDPKKSDPKKSDAKKK